MPRTREIALSNLLLDLQNPRLADGQATQRDIIRAMLDAQGEKLIVLAEDILTQGGLNPTEQILVMPDEKSDRRFVVLEGNRRVTALKILDQPELAEGIYSKPLFNRLRKLSQQFIKHPVRKVNCAIVETRAEADHWIELRHAGEQQGAGLVSWGATEGARFRARRGKASAVLKLLDFVRDHGGLDDATKAKLGTISITNLQRLVNDPYVREKLGFDKQKEEIITDLPDSELAKGVGRMVRDLAHQRIIVSDIDNKKQRKDYVDGFLKEELPDRSKTTNSSRTVRTAATGDNSPVGKTSTKTTPASNKPRATLIPKGCVFGISNPRISNISRELRYLKLEEYPNSAAVLLRVFLELSVDEYLTNKTPMSPQQRENSRLHEKVSAVANHIESEKKMSSQELMPVRRAIQEQNLLAASVRTLHAYVHNKHFNPSAGELRTAWDNLELFLKTIWS